MLEGVHSILIIIGFSGFRAVTCPTRRPSSLSWQEEEEEEEFGMLRRP